MMMMKKQCLDWLVEKYKAVPLDRQEYTISAGLFKAGKKTWQYYTLDNMDYMVDKLFEYNANGYDVYYGIGLHYGPLRKIITRQGRKEISRFSTCDISFFPYSVIDFDIGKNADLPQSEAEAMAAIAKAPFKVDSITYTGGGLHLYFAMDNGFIDDNNRPEFKHKNEVIHSAVKYYFKKTYRWIFDSTQDLARMDRLPNTYNYRHGDKILGRII